MGIHRSAVMRQDRADAIATKKVNRLRKNKERARRDARIVARIQAGDLPYTPEVMSWLSRALNIPSSKITQDDVNRLLAC